MWWGVVGVLLAVCVARLQGTKVVQTSTVFKAGEANYSCFRVPSIATVGDVVLVFAEARKGSCGDQAPKDIVYKHSTDNGHTWGNLSVLVGEAGTNHTFRNPYATVSKTPQRASALSGSCPVMLIVSFVNSTLAEPWTNQRRVSCDAGKTWSSIEDMALALWEGVLAGPGTGIEVTIPPFAADKRSAGELGGIKDKLGSSVSSSWSRIVSCGATGYHAGHAMNAVVWFSDNRGQVYNVSSSVFAQMQECQVVQLWNGTLVMNMRNSHLNPCKCRAYALSHDGGATWEGPFWAPQLIEPVCSAGLIRLNDSMYFSNPHSTSQRINMTVQVTHSNSMDWRVYEQLWPGPSAYSVMGVNPEGKPCVAYERGSSSPYEELAFAILNPA